LARPNPFDGAPKRAQDEAMRLRDWPLFELEVATPRLVLRPPTDDDFPGLLDAIDAGIHDPGEMPFSIPWTDAEPAARRRSAIQHWWSVRASFSPQDWHVPFAVFRDGEAIGYQDLFAVSFPALRAVKSGSWLTRAAQGQHLGREMRAAVLTFAFDVLGTEVAESAAWFDNRASLAVSRVLGYEPNGTRRMLRRGVPTDMVDLRLTRERWQATRLELEVDVRGFDGCRHMFETEPAP
jgi:RimJ/RimL family protein N-acetyltransferase